MALELWTRARSRCLRTGAHLFFRRRFPIRSEIPYISFTFDDFPLSALNTGGAILKHYGFLATYYACFGLMGKQASVGAIFRREDVGRLLAQGHEIGSHTFAHCHASETAPDAFEMSVMQNQTALASMAPGVSFRTLSYPISDPRPATKRRMARYFNSCRAGGQRFNAGVVDLNRLAAYFLEQSRDNAEAVKHMIDQNRRARGWLIFATHDISDAPSRWGCTTGFFEKIVARAAASGARVLPVSQAWDELRAGSTIEAIHDRPVFSGPEDSRCFPR